MQVTHKSGVHGLIMTLFYRTVRLIVATGFRGYFRKIYFTGLENIPDDKPLLVAANHPTAFLEPLLLATVLPLELHFITRGDVFQNPLYRYFLEALNMIPIFRFRDGFANMKNNHESIDHISKVLEQRKAVLIFSEGRTITEKRLRPIQKGTARMAFDSYQQSGDLDLQILPVSVNYTAPHSFRSAVMIAVGAPILLREYYAQYADNPNKTIATLTHDIGKKLLPLMVNIADSADDALAENAFTLYRNAFPEPVFPIYGKNERRLMAEREIANRLNEMPSTEKNEWNQKINNYFQTLKALKVNDLGVAQPYHATLGAFLTLLIGAVPFAIGAVFHAFPVWLAEKMRRERTNGVVEFEGPVLFAVSTWGMVLYYLLCFLLLLIFQARWFLWGTWVAMPFLGFYALQYWDKRAKYRAARQFLALKKAQQAELTATRAALLRQVRNI